MSKSNIIFICHGSICRSPMAQFIFLDEINKRGMGDRYEVTSLAVSNEEYGNDIDPRAKEQLRMNHVPFAFHPARRISLEEFRKADHIYTMDKSNISYLKYLFPDEDFSKVELLNDPYEISDPWYTHNFSLAFFEIKHAIIFRLLEGDKP